MLVSDMLHQSLAEDPHFDPAGIAYSAVRSAVLDAVGALAYLDGIPDRAGYIQRLGELYADQPAGVPKAAAMLANVAAWIEEAAEAMAVPA